MVYVRFHYDCGYCGCDNDEYMEFEEGEYTESDLDVMLCDCLLYTSDP